MSPNSVPCAANDYRAASGLPRQPVPLADQARSGGRVLMSFFDDPDDLSANLRGREHQPARLGQPERSWPQ